MEGKYPLSGGWSGVTQFALVFILSVLSISANAATFVVTRFDDTAAVGSGIPGNGTGVSGDLRSAIISANTAAGAEWRLDRKRVVQLQGRHG